MATNDTLTFKTLDEHNNEVECEILFTFENIETGQNYIIYTDHSFDEDGNTKVYASTFDPDAPVAHLEPIRSDAEWKMIEAILEELQAEVFAECYD